MFFLFGWGRRTTKDAGPTLGAKCPNCGNQTWLHLFSYRTWFTLFFIPVIPYESKTLLLCPVCSRGIQLQGDQIKRAQQLNAQTKAFLANQMGEAEYEMAVRENRVLS